MGLAEVVLRLRSAVPALEQRVGGTASFIRANQANADIALPHAFVVPMYSTAAPKTDGATYQMLTERFAIILALDNTIDPRNGDGRAAMVLMGTIFSQLVKAMLNWEPMQRFDTVQFARGLHLSMNQERMWHQFEWTYRYYIDGDYPVPDTPALITQLYQHYNPTGAVATPDQYIEMLQFADGQTQVQFPWPHGPVYASPNSPEALFWHEQAVAHDAGLPCDEDEQ